MANTDVFSGRMAMPVFSGGAADRPARRTSVGGSLLRLVFFGALLAGAGYGGLQYMKWHRTPTWDRNEIAVTDARSDARSSGDQSTANDHLPSSLPEIRVKDRNEP